MFDKKEKQVKPKKIKSFVLTTIIMFIFWVVLSWNFEPVFLSIGIICSLLVAYWSHDLLIGEPDFGLTVRRYLSLAKFVPWLLWQIILANLHVVYLTLNPKDLIEPIVIRFNPNLQTEMGVVILANSITLTPGTVTIMANKDEFIVHAITHRDAESLLQGEMQARVRDIEQGKI
ncbi:MAG TPA: Na+/H+ antiporter subunit E [Gelria sp.]|jgi:multicomponent Na+:H+ antiporter subunit E|nr:Na+/H+ antiporter subunit E [Gelria sp.]